MHFYSAFIVYRCTPKALYNHVGGLPQPPPVCSVVNFFLVEAETRRRWDIFQAEVTLY